MQPADPTGDKPDPPRPQRAAVYPESPPFEPVQPPERPPPPPPPPASSWPPSPPSPPSSPPSSPGHTDDHGGPAPSRKRPRLLVAALGGIVLGAAVASGTTAAIMANDDDDSSRTVVARPPIVTPEGVMDIQAILDKVQESVVTIETSGSTSDGVFEGAGTGIVLSADGMVLTNSHVISGTDEIQVRMFDGASHDASLVGSSPDDDLAVIQLSEVGDLNPAKLGSSDALTVGEPVIAIGNALNLGGQPTVTQGIVSATNRSIEGPVAGGGTVSLSGLIQTDAAINPGNSGGPLVDVSGEVVGINTAIADGQNIGFAIAIDGVKQLIEDLRNGQGEITPDSAFLGVSTVNVDTIPDSVRRELGISAEEGAFVQDVQPDSAAEAAGIKAADVILEVDGQKVSTSGEVAEIISGHQAGDEISIKIQREGEDLTVTATLGRRGG